MNSHGSNALSGPSWNRGAFFSDQFRPDAIPCFLAKEPAFQDTVAGFFQTAGFGGVHVPAPGEALVEICVTDAERIGQSAAYIGGDFSAHTTHLSDSLHALQANRYNGICKRVSSNSLDNAYVETNNERRRRKLGDLCKLHGIAAVAEKGQLSAVYVEQILKGVKLPEKGDGSRSERALGETAARAIEEAYELGRGWFDNDGDDTKMNALEMLLVGYFRQLEDAALQAVVVENLREAVEDRNRLAEKLKYGKPVEQRSGELQGGISQVGAFDEAPVRGVRK